MALQLDSQETVAGLPVAGYKDTQPQWAIDAVNANKILEERVLRQLDLLKANPAIDQRWLATARTDIEKGFTSANRAVFQPNRIANLPEDGPSLAERLLEAANGQCQTIERNGVRYVELWLDGRMISSVRA